MVKKLSDSIALYLSNELQYDQEKKEIISYGLEIFLGESFKIIAGLILSLILGIFSYTLIGMTCFIGFRVFIGGAHNETYGKCFITSVILMLCMGVLGKYYYYVVNSNLWVIFIIYGLACIATLLWVPAGTEKKEIKNETLRKKMKIKTIFLLTSWMILMLCILSTNFYQYVFSSILGVIFAFFFITPLAYKIT